MTRPEEKVGAAAGPIWIVETITGLTVRAGLLGIEI